MKHAQTMSMMCRPVALLVALVPIFLSSKAHGQTVTGTAATSDGLLIHCQNAMLQLQIWNDRIIRVRYTTGTGFSAPSVSAVIAKPANARFEAIDNASYVGLRTNAVEARVDRGNGAVTFVDCSNGKPFLAEVPQGRSSTTQSIDGQTIHGRAQTFVRQPGEAIIGLGQHQDGEFNYTNTRIHLMQENSKIGIPVLTSSAGYTLLWDNPAVSDVDFNKDTVRWSSEFGDTTDYYIFYGPDLNRAIAGYRKLTGDAPLFGKWVWGLWQSRERYVSQDDLLSTAMDYRKRNIPIDGMVQDWQYWSPNPWGSHAFGPGFPDPSAMMKQLHDAHFHAIISVWAKFDEGSSNYVQMQAAGNLYPTIYANVYPAGRSKWYDAFKPAARQMYWQQINDEIAVHGWDGWWLDATEPELGGKWGEMRSLQTDAGPGYAVYNAYPLLTTTAVYDGQKSRLPAERPFILTRSAYAGQQRNGAISWSGDITGSWDVLKKQVPAGLNFVASGIPYWNTDTGGFFGGDPNDEIYREIFTRWFQFSTFCPLLRIHGTGPHKPIWAFGDANEKILLAFDQLRYRLLPYIYSTSWQVTSNQASMMRPLLIDYPSDANVHNIGDQFMFGPSLMVCPVTDPVGGLLAVIPSSNLIDTTGKPGGLSATYYQGENFDREITRRIDPAIDFNWDKVKREGVGANRRTDPVPGLEMDRFSARWEGSIQTHRAGTYTFQLEADDGMRMWIDNHQVTDDWKRRKMATSLVKLELPADSRIPIKIEYFQHLNMAAIDLRWRPPAEEKSGTFTRKVYLPTGTWYDFWTSQIIPGQRTIDAPSPIERMPLFVKAGTILPLGPDIQYTDEKPDAPLEIRIYKGADGQFTLYDDAGDGYGYETGQRATIPISWTDKSGALVLGARIGSYPGMPAHREFRIVIVNNNHGAGPDLTDRPDNIVNYDGTPQTIVVH